MAQCMEEKLHELTQLGFNQFFDNQLNDTKAIPARIAAEHRGRYEIWSAAGTGYAKLAGRLLSELSAETFPGVGDWVTLDSAPDPDRTSLITGVLDRRTAFTRVAAGREAKSQVIAANVDVMFVVTGLDEDYNLRRIERYLAPIWAGGANPVVVLNKADTCDDAEARVLEVEASAPGVTVLAVSALKADGLEPIRRQLPVGVTGAFVGSSGVGKSTLLNALMGEEHMATGEVRAYDSRGRHTTTHRQMFLIPNGGLVIDTPGMRELSLVDEQGIDAVFRDIERLGASCRFRDCTHGNEPGCAVREAISTGELPAERWEHYLKLEKEARANELRRDVRLRRETEREFSKRIANHQKLHRRLKGGK